MGQFSESEYYLAYKRVRNKCRKYNSLSIINSCLRYLYEPTSEKVDELQKQPWLILLLIKWILIDKNGSSGNNKDITEREFNLILQAVHNLGSVTRLPSDFDNLTLFMRSMAYQQFFYQQPFSQFHLARQSILFSNLPSNHLIKIKFKELVGVTIPQFIELSLVTSINFLDNRSSDISISWYRNMLTEYSSKEISHFLKSISLPLLSIQKKLLDQDDGRRFAHEVLEQTPFLETPFIQVDHNFVCFYPSVLYRCLDSFVYDRLRAWDAEKFMSKFGSIFERYVERTVKHMGLPYVNEQELKNSFDNSGNLIDFILTDTNANIFIDAKAVEMASQGKVTHLSDVVRDKTKNSVLKAIKQAHDVLRQLENSKPAGLQLKPRQNNYLLVITFKELYLGNGQTFYDAIAKEKIDEIYREYDNYTQIELGNMYFITIDQFDVLSELVKSKKIGLSEAIEEAKAKDSEPSTKKFDFGMHLETLVADHTLQQPEFLSEEASDIFSGVRNTLELMDSMSVGNDKRD